VAVGLTIAEYGMARLFTVGFPSSCATVLFAAVAQRALRKLALGDVYCISHAAVIALPTFPAKPVSKPNSSSRVFKGFDSCCAVLLFSKSGPPDP